MSPPEGVVGLIRCQGLRTVRMAIEATATTNGGTHAELGRDRRPTAMGGSAPQPAG